jgi:A/G-specific adenine glycosylase
MRNISKNLIIWYSQFKRDLPWRNTSDPYLIWVSEIILQQTRVDQGISYYFNFIKTFPNIKSLAQANIDEVLNVWQGLGYYSRARNMYHTANVIVNSLNSKFPENFIELKKLKGIGDYTAAAIASFPFKEPIPAVDGNVFRVLSRLYGIFESTQSSNGKKTFYNKALDLIDKKQPDVFNQAIMEFGALQCTPTNPNCNLCIFKSICFAYNRGLISELPLKKQKIKKRERYFYFLHLIYKDTFFIEKRTSQDIWKLLHQFPLIESDSEISIDEIVNHKLWYKIFKNINPKINSNIVKKKHVLSHQIIHANFLKIEVPNTNEFIDKNLINIHLEDLNKYSIPRLIDRYLNENK